MSHYTRKGELYVLDSKIDIKEGYVTNLDSFHILESMEVIHTSLQISFSMMVLILDRYLRLEEDRHITNFSC